MDPPSPSGYFGYDSHQDEGFLELRLPASQPLLKVVVGCFVLLYRNKVCLVFGLFLFLSFFCANAF